MCKSKSNYFLKVPQFLKKWDLEIYFSLTHTHPRFLSLPRFSLSPPLSLSLSLSLSPLSPLAFFPFSPFTFLIATIFTSSSSHHHQHHHQINGGGSAVVVKGSSSSSSVKKNMIQVSNTKKPLYFYVNLAKVYIYIYIDFFFFFEIMVEAWMLGPPTMKLITFPRT
ncbi:hypothetical protein Syun_025481 [Stephania yunnanensis]|uniref:Transmembrane protein n=1 Tax=Stephania yunnanensis TaxID=152371 RepID=A0AAP0ERR3_9MAGN